MLIVVSPAKKMDMSPVDAGVTQPVFSGRAQELAEIARGLSVAELQKLMHISENLAKLNADRFRDFGQMERKPAALAFAGDTYIGLDAGSLDAEEMEWAQRHFRILSGLYGVLRPMDEIQPYRLEMGSRLKNPLGKNLYEYWGEDVARVLAEQAEQTGSEVLVNCASQEYFGAVDLKTLGLRVMTPVFMEEKPSGPKIVSFFAKRARGAMARFIIQHRLADAKSLTDFDAGGYQYQPQLSDPERPVFVRPAQIADAA